MMKIYAIRLKPNDDLKQSLKNFAIQQNIKAGFILSGIGSLKQAQIRFANQEMSTTLTEKFEILALRGCFKSIVINIKNPEPNPPSPPSL